MPVGCGHVVSVGCSRSGCGCRGTFRLHILLRGFALQESLQEAFTQEGFICKDCHVHERTITNHKTGVSMARRWIQGAWSLPPGPSAALCHMPLVADGAIDQATVLACKPNERRNGMETRKRATILLSELVLPQSQCSQRCTHLGASAATQVRNLL